MHVLLLPEPKEREERGKGRRDKSGDLLLCKFCFANRCLLHDQADAQGSLSFCQTRDSALFSSSFRTLLKDTVEVSCRNPENRPCNNVGFREGNPTHRPTPYALDKGTGSTRRAVLAGQGNASPAFLPIIHTPVPIPRGSVSI
jgi:hypothetical protein